MPRRVAILYNPDEGLRHGAALDALAARGVRHAAEAVLEACIATGWEARSIAAPESPGAFLEAVREARADVVFNLVEALGGESRWEAGAAWLLELSGVPYTGSPPLALALGLEKPLVKDLLRARGVAVPDGAVLARGDEPLPDDLPFPCLVKPVHEDASHGISRDSVVADPAAARRRARWVAEHYAQPALVEEFVCGRELNVSILGHGDALRVLPLAEIDFTGFPAGVPPLVTYEAKWVPESPEYRGTSPVPARDLPAELEGRIVATAAAAYRAIGVRDYGRVDLRLHDERGPLVLEVNPNPDLSPDAGLARAAARAGMSYAQLVTGILDAALERARAHP